MDKREQKYQEQLTRILETIRRNYELDNFNFVFEHSWKKYELPFRCIIPLYLCCLFIFDAARYRLFIAIAGFAFVIAASVWIWCSLNKAEGLLYSSLQPFELKCLVEQHMRVEMLAEIDRINSEMKSAESLFALQRNRSELDNIISYYDYSFAKLSKTNLHIK